MATPKQQQVAREIVEGLATGKPRTKKRVLQSVGYSKATSEGHTKKIFDSEGVKEELIKLGFSLDEADGVIGEILHKGKKDSDRIKAAQEIYKRLGGYAPEKSQSIHVNIDASPDDPRVKKLAKRFEDELKNLIVEDIKEK